MNLRLLFAMALLQSADYLTTRAARMLGGLEMNPFLRDALGLPDLGLVALAKTAGVLLFTWLLIRNFRKRVAVALCLLMTIVVVQNLIALYGLSLM